MAWKRHSRQIKERKEKVLVNVDQRNSPQPRLFRLVFRQRQSGDDGPSTTWRKMTINSWHAFQFNSFNLLCHINGILYFIFIARPGSLKEKCIRIKSASEGRGKKSIEISIVDRKNPGGCLVFLGSWWTLFNILLVENKKTRMSCSDQRQGGV